MVRHACLRHRFRSFNFRVLRRIQLHQAEAADGPAFGVQVRGHRDVRLRGQFDRLLHPCALRGEHTTAGVFSFLMTQLIE